tara:strand:+ start:106 stop:423 length:318 start_codon:yes stop_codon:yes gene_type:complete
MVTRQLPAHVKQYYQFTSAVNLAALMYSVSIWTRNEDFSFVQWPVVVWAIASNISSIFIEKVMAERTGVYVKVHAAIVFSCVWLLICGLKLAYGNKQSRKKTNTC